MHIAPPSSGPQPAFSDTLELARLAALRRLTDLLAETDSPAEARRCAVAILAIKPPDPDDDDEFVDDEEDDDVFTTNPRPCANPTPPRAAPNLPELARKLASALTQTSGRSPHTAPAPHARAADSPSAGGAPDTPPTSGSAAGPDES